LSDESAELFRSHDICHVIFGLDTTFADEAMVAHFFHAMSGSGSMRAGVSKIHLDNDSRRSPSSSGNLAGLEDTEETALGAAAGIPKS
jgi:hypothetical protein